MRHALLSLISVVVSALKGVEYVLGNDEMILVALVQMLTKMPPKEDGNVAHRFCIAIVQKMSIKHETIPVLVDLNLIDYIIGLIKRSQTKKIHVFSLDFATALLANILHAKTTFTYFQQPANKPKLAFYIKDLLSLIKMPNTLATSVLMHILISLNYLKKEQFVDIVEDECHFSDTISEFVDAYSKVIISEKENDEIDKRTVLDLCAHMFHPKDSSGNDLS
jgi:hypothetical protein